MITSAKRAAGLCALLAGTCLVSPASAQSTGVPSAYKNIDDNGVDLTDGSFNFSLVEGSIGAGEGAIAAVRQWGRSGWTDNLQTIYLHRQLAGTTPVIHVMFGNRSERFTGANAGGIFTADQGNGATLAIVEGAYRYRGADGSEIVFGIPPEVNDTGGRSSFCNNNSETLNDCKLLALSAGTPDGKRVRYDWDIVADCANVIDPVSGGIDCVQYWRLRSIGNAFGYSVTVAYRDDAQPPAGSGPHPDWFKRASLVFANDAVAGGPTPRVTYAYPAGGVTEVTDTGGRTWRFTMGAGGLTAIRRPGAASDTIVVGYGPEGVTQVTRDGVTTGYARTVSGSTATTTVTDALNGQRTVVSDLNIGRPTRVTDETGRATSFAYDGNGRLTGVTAPEGNQVLTAYDARGNATSTTVRARPGSGLADIVATAGYEAGCANPATCNQPQWTRDAAGHRTDYAYNEAGQVTSVTAPAATAGAVRPQVRYGYTAVTAPDGGTVSLPTRTSSCATGAACAETADELRTTVAYGTPNLLPSQVSTGAGDGSLTAVTAMGYDAVGNLVSVDGPLPGAADTTRTRYNAAREAVGAVGPDPDGAGPMRHRAVRTTIDAQGFATAQESGAVADQSDGAWGAFQSLERTDATFDANGRLRKRTLSAGGTVHGAVEYAYDAEGRLTCTAQRMNPASFGSLNDACTPTAAGAFGPDRLTRTLYDAAGRVLASEVAVGTADHATEARATYTGNGQVLTLTDGENNRTTYGYDGHDRLSRTLYPVAQKGADASNAGDYEELGYDSRGNVTSRRLRDGQAIGYGYDALGRLVLKDVPNIAPDEGDVWHDHDLLGRVVATSDSIGHRQAYAYDGLGRMTSEASNWYGTVGWQYDVAGRRTRLTHRDGFFVTYEHLVTGETTAIRENGGLALATFGYDDLGRRTSLTRGNGTSTGYSYDPVSRLQTLTQDIGGSASDLQLGFAYNPASQIVSNTRSNDGYSFTGHGSSTIGATANGLNQLVEQGGASMTYDGRGNLISDGAKTYGYTSENRLVTGPGTRQYYDALGRLFYLSGSATDFRYDGVAAIAETEPGGGGTRRRYVHGPGTDEPLVWYEGSGTSDRRYLHADERGSIVAVSDDAGNVLGINRYDEYGVPASSNIGRFQYTGQKWLPELGLYDYKARMYWAGGGRFLQTDPIGYGDGMNLYAYVGGDPVNLTDPSGLCDQPGDLTDDAGEPCEDIVVTARKLKDTGGSGGGIIRSGGGDRGPNVGAGLGGRRGRRPAAPVSPEQPKQKPEKPKCISSKDGPVYIYGGGLVITTVVGAGIEFYKFKIPSIGASGRVATGSFTAGLNVSLGFSFGRINNFGNLLGNGSRFATQVPGFPGAGGELIFGSDGNMSGAAGSVAAGGGAFIGLTKTSLLSSNLPVCK